MSCMRGWEPSFRLWIISKWKASDDLLDWRTGLGEESEWWGGGQLLNEEFWLSGINAATIRAIMTKRAPNTNGGPGISCKRKKKYHI